MGPAITVDDELEEREDIDDGGEELSVERVEDGLAGLLLFDTVWLGCGEKGLVFSTLRVGVDSELEGYICDGSLLGVGGGEKTRAASCALSGEATIGRVLVLR